MRGKAFFVAFLFLSIFLSLVAAVPALAFEGGGTYQGGPRDSRAPVSEDGVTMYVRQVPLLLVNPSSMRAEWEGGKVKLYLDDVDAVWAEQWTKPGWASEETRFGLAALYVPVNAGMSPASPAGYREVIVPDADFDNPAVLEFLQEWGLDVSKQVKPKVEGLAWAQDASSGVFINVKLPSREAFLAQGAGVNEALKQKWQALLAHPGSPDGTVPSADGSTSYLRAVDAFQHGGTYYYHLLVSDVGPQENNYIYAAKQSPYYDEEDRTGKGFYRGREWTQSLESTNPAAVPGFIGAVAYGVNLKLEGPTEVVGYPGEEKEATFTVKNLSTVALAADVGTKREGEGQYSIAVKDVSVAAGGSAPVTLKFKVESQPYRVRVAVNPFKNVLETYYEDNYVDVVVKPLPPDFYAKIDPHSVQAEPGQGLTFTATFGLKPTFPQPWKALVRAFHVVNGVEYPVTLEPLDGAPPPSDDGVLFAPGQEFCYRVRVTAQEADSRVVVKINPVGTSEDADWSDNRDEAAVNVYRQQFRPGDRRLHLQAYSKPGEDLYGNWQPAKARDPFTAKWTDDVHATLTVERPTPPRGTLDWWEITWAKLTYPKRHPDFMFGNPLPPQGTVTINMNVPGRGLEEEKQATAVFEEDWALDGFPVYNMETGEVMAENPKYYPITVQFKVTYQYHYIVCSGDPPSCEVVTVVDSYTDTATANLLVNGTGTVPYAH